MKIIFEEHLFDHADVLIWCWLLTVIYLHISCIRTINSRFGYSKTTFSHRNKAVQGLIYLTLLPLVLLDWKCARNFSFYLAQTWAKFWFIIFLVKLAL